MGLGRRFVAGYGMAHGGKSLFWHAGELLLGFVFTEVWRMPPGQAGAMLALSMLVSGCMDLFVGKWLGVQIGSTRDAASVQWFASLACGAAFVALGMAGLAPGIYRSAVGLGALFAFRFSYPFVDVPQNVLFAVASRNDESRATMSAVRYVAGGMASVVVAAGIAPTLIGTNGHSTTGAFAVLLIAIALIAMITSNHLRRTVQLECAPSKSDPLITTRYATEPKQIKIGRCAIFFVMFLVSMGLSVFGRLQPYYVAYGARLGGATFMICVMAGAVISQPVWLHVCRRVSLAQTLGLASMALIISAWTFAHLARADIVVLVMLGTLYGAATGGVLMSLWALLAKMAEASGTVAVMANIMAMFTFSAKMGLACAACVTGLILSTSDYHSRISTAVVDAMALAPIVGGGACLMLSARLLANKMVVGVER